MTNDLPMASRNADHQRLGEIASDIEVQMMSLVPGRDMLVNEHPELAQALKTARKEVLCVQRWLLEDKQRRCEEALKAEQEAAERAKEPEVSCSCYGSLFSHDIDCALNLERARLAGYELRKL